LTLLSILGAICLDVREEWEDDLRKCPESSFAY
jgi:hypothetical protein